MKSSNTRHQVQQFLLLSAALPLCGTLTSCQAAPAQVQAAPIQPANADGHLSAGVQRVLLSPLDVGSPVGKGAYAMNQLAVEAAPATIPPKFGASALSFSGQAESGGAKGDFTVSGAVPGQPKTLGAWMFLAPGANVRSVGFQFYDAQGEGLMFQTPADWTGWKWVEVNFQTSPVVQAYAQADKNGKADFPLKDVHVIWFSKTAGPSVITVDALSATTELDQAPPATLQTQVGGGDVGEPGQPLSSQLVLTNFGAQDAAPRVDFSIQRDSQFFSLAPPDPVYGSDQALGAKSWTEVEGKKIEEGSLTDGKDWTGIRPGFSKGGGTEAFQFVDLGKTRQISRLAYQANDGNWAWKVDVSASQDGQNYQPVPELQGVNVHNQWGPEVFPDFKPFPARFVRLRYHKDGEKVGDVAMFNGLSVYDGITDESLDFPKIGEVVGTGSLWPKIPAHDFVGVALKSDKALSPGNYLLALRIKDGAKTQLTYRHFLVMPEALKAISPASRFGLNTNNYLYAPWHRRLGIGWVRFENMKWPMTSPKPDTYSFTGVAPWNLNHDQIISAFRAQNINFLPFLFQTPEYATSAPANVQKNRDSYPPKDNAQMADFVFQTVARYGSKKHPASELKTQDKKSGLNQINTYEIWNEPNLNDPNWGPWVGTTDQYNSLFRASAEAVKRADPTARVTNGGFAGIDVETVNTLLKPYADGKKPLDFVDVLNVHFYSGRTAPELSTNDPNADRSGQAEGVRTYEDDLRRLVTWRDKNKPGLPIWMSETGYDSSGPFGTNERYQAAQLPRDIMMALAAGLEKVIVFRDSGSTPTMFGASGVVRDDETLKPSWFTYATLIRQLDGVQTGALRLPYPDPNVRLYAWTRGQETILTAWTIENPATLKLQLGQSTVTDAFGATRPTKIAGDLPLSMFPVYIKSIGNPAGLAPLVAQAKREESARKAKQARLAKTRAYLFDFGSKDKVGTIDIGDTRLFTPVISTDLYDEAKGYGFFPDKADHDDSRHWISDALETDSTRMSPGQNFQFKVKPGRYQLRLHIQPQSPAKLFIKGLLGGDKTVAITPDGPPITLDVQASDGPISISNDGFGDLFWVSLVEQAAPAQPAR